MKNTCRSILACTALAALALAGCSSNGTSSSEDKTTWDQIEEQGYITFATEGTYSPYSYHDDSDTLTGYDVEVAKAVAEELGLEAKFVETQWDGIIAGLDAGKYDAIANQVSITEEREEKYLFSTPYTYSYGVLIVNGDNEEITSFEDLSGKSAAQTTTSNWGALAESYGAELVSTSGFSESVQLVEQGRADGTINDSVTFLDYKAQQPDANVKVAAQTEEYTETAFLFRKDDVELQEEVNKALDALEESGRLAEISEQFFGEDISVQK